MAIFFTQTNCSLEQNISLHVSLRSLISQVKYLVRQESLNSLFFINCTLLLISKNIHRNNIFKVIDNVSHTRSNNVDLNCPVFRTTLFQNSVIHCGPKLFNSLPYDLKILITTNKSRFKHEIKNYLLRQQNGG